MKSKIIKLTAAIVFVGALALTTTQASPSPPSMQKSVEITGCLQQGPVAKEYILQSNDGSTWGVIGADKNMYMNNYVGQTVTLAGDAMHPSVQVKAAASEQNSPTINHYIRAMDVAVDNETCQR